MEKEPWPGPYLPVLKQVVSLALVLLILYLFITQFFSLTAPFILAYLISSLAEPAVSFLENRIRIARKAASLLVLILFILLFGTLLTLILFNLYREALDLAGNVTHYVKDANNDLFLLYNRAKALYFNLPPQVISAIQQYTDTFSRNLSLWITAFLEGTIGLLSSLPRVVIFILFTLIASYYMSSDRKKIRSFFYNQVSKSLASRIYHVKTDILAAMVGYLKAYTILITLTFIELAVGLTLMGERYALVLALVISLIDALPVLGSGSILIPWALWLSLTGNLTQALWLFGLYAVIFAVRQFFEPKIVGAKVGLHPLVTLISMYLGLSLVGVAGLFLGPITFILLKNLQKAGLIQLWKEV